MSNPAVRQNSSTPQTILSCLGATGSIVAGWGVLHLPTVLQPLQPNRPVANFDGLSGTRNPGAVDRSVAVEDWQDAIWGTIDSSPIFEKAESLRQSSRFRAACDALSTIPVFHPDYKKARALIEDSATQILTRAVDKYVQGNPGLAQRYLQAIPEDTQAFAAAHLYSQQWQL